MASTAKPHGPDRSETSLKPHGFRPLANPLETFTGRLRNGFGEAVYTQKVVGSDFISFEAPQDF